MMRSLAILFLSAAIAGAQEIPMSLSAINKARAERGLSPVVELQSLDSEARDFMAYNLQLGHISHNAAPYTEKLTLQLMYAMSVELETLTSASSWVMWELLAQGTLQPSWKNIAHIFDKSPEHAVVFYSPRLKWVGFCLWQQGAMWLYVFYGVVEN